MDVQDFTPVVTWEVFAPLSAVSFVRHAFVQRVPGMDVCADRATVMQRLESIHRRAVRQMGLGGRVLVTAEQIHGSAVARVDSSQPGRVPGADGLITNDPAVCLGIHVADCGAIYLVDTARRAIGLLHSGKKGTELGILHNGLRAMQEAFGTDPADVLVQLGPCIRPPHYEVDFAGEIRAQAKAAGVGDFHDCGLCTASDPGKYYSYRREKGLTGRLLAVLALAGAD